MDLILLAENNEKFLSMERDFNEYISNYISSFRESSKLDENEMKVYRYVLARWDEINRIRDEREIYATLHMVKEEESLDTESHQPVHYTHAESLKSCLRNSEHRKPSRSVVWSQELIEDIQSM